VAAEDPVAADERAAEATAATPDGKKYEDQVGTAFGREQGKSIQACAREVKRPDLSDFHVFVRVSAAGQVEEALVKPSTNLAACLQGKLRAWKVGAPRLRTMGRVHVKLRASRPPGEEPQNKELTKREPSGAAAYPRCSTDGGA
jgi:hypothetical protein